MSIQDVDVGTKGRPTPDHAMIARFLTTVYGEAQDGYLVLSSPDDDPTHVTAKGKPWLRSVWLDLAQVSLAQAAEIAATRGQKATVYAGVALQRPDSRPDSAHRSTNAGAYVVPGLWFDLDLAYGQHAASALPATDDEALDFLRTLPAPPSLIIHSGGGLYGWWLFREPFLIATEQDREAIATLSKRFTATLVQAGNLRGWTLDAVHDLARVLRPPGTINWKYGTPVELLHEGAERYNPSDFDWLVELPTRASTTHAGAALAGQPDLAAIAEHYGTALDAKSKTELAGAHPQHGSSTGDNFNVNVAKGLWHCWRHATGGDALSLIAVCEGLVSCEDMRAGALKGKTFTQVVAIANATFQAEIHLDAEKHRNGSTPGAEPSWTDALNKTKGGEAKETFNNLALGLEHLSPWDAHCWYDVVRDGARVDTSPLDDAQVWQAARALEQHGGIPIRNLRLVASALRSRCHERKRDLLQEWLAALTPWDGIKRLTEYLSDHAGVPKTPYTMAVGRLLVVSMVARALHPGIQCRSVVIFEGKQDIGKSRLVKTLTGEEWYREVSGTLEGKEAHMLMKGAWVVELSEMDVMLRTEEARVKSFITMCNDEYVPKYANDPVKLARRTILVGTINPEGDGSYLRDQTGATRYYPVPVGAIELQDIAACRDQLFAEALVWFSNNPDTWWQMPAEATEELETLREARRKEGVFEGPKLQGWLAKVHDGTGSVEAPFHTEDALRYCFNMAPERWNAATKDQMGKAISKYGWASKPSRARGGLQRLWHFVGKPLADVTGGVEV
jgi:hypothetical protein